MIILTEKPNVAEAIASAIGGYEKQKGFYSKGSDCIVSAQGHLLTLNEPEDYDAKYSKWRLEDLPICPDRLYYKPIPQNYKVLQKIKNCFNEFDSSEFILATDAEREGEVIGAEILNFLKYSNPSAKRFWVSEALTKDVVLAGLKNAKPLINFEKYKREGFARAQADWLVGMNISRLISVSAKTLCTFGRVQTAILAAIYLREKSISEFVPVPYNQFEVTSSKENKNFTLYLIKDNEDRFKENDSFLIQAANDISRSDTVKILKVEKEKKTENPPQLFNITGLQKYCSQFYKITPAKTLEIAQSLYEDFKCLSYPRTPSVVLGDENVELYRTKYELLSETYPELSQRCDNLKISPENKRLFNSKKLQDHHGLIPLDVLPDSASESHRQVYEAVLKRFFDVIKPPFIYEQCKVKAQIKDYNFSGSGRIIIQKGFKDNFDDDDVQEFPELQDGDTTSVIKTEVLYKLTKSKKHYTNASILALMENPKGEDENLGKLVGLGTPATRADIIEKLLKREYIVQQGQTLLITEKGKFLIEAILKVPELKDFISIAKTTEWEEKLAENPEGFLLEIKSFIKFKLQNIHITDVWVDPGLGVCPVCKKGHIKENAKAFSCTEWKNGCSFSIWKEICGAKITASDVKILLSGGKIKPKKMKSKAGKEFSAPLELVNGKIEFVFKK